MTIQAILAGKGSDVSTIGRDQSVRDAVALLGLGDEGVDTVGVLPAGVPSPELPWTGFSDIGPLLVAAVGISIQAVREIVTPHHVPAPFTPVTSSRPHGAPRCNKPCPARVAKHRPSTIFSCRFRLVVSRLY